MNTIIYLRKHETNQNILLQEIAKMKRKDITPLSFLDYILRKYVHGKCLKRFAQLKAQLLCIQVENVKKQKVHPYTYLFSSFQNNVSTPTSRAKNS